MVDVLFVAFLFLGKYAKKINKKLTISDFQGFFVKFDIANLFVHTFEYHHGG